MLSKLKAQSFQWNSLAHFSARFVLCRKQKKFFHDYLCFFYREKISQYWFMIKSWDFRLLRIDNTFQCSLSSRFCWFFLIEVNLVTMPSRLRPAERLSDFFWNTQRKSQTHEFWKGAFLRLFLCLTEQLKSMHFN